MIDQKTFNRGLALLASMLGGKEIDEPMAKFYYRTLDSLMTTEQFTMAVYAVAATERFFPSPAVLLDKVTPLTVVQPKPADAAKLEGASIFDRIPHECGTYSPLGIVIDEQRVRAVFGEQGVMAFRGIGGNKRYRTMTETAEPWARQQFADAYATAVGMLAARGDLQLPTAIDSRTAALIGTVAARLALPKRSANRQLDSGTSTA